MYAPKEKLAGERENSRGIFDVQGSVEFDVFESEVVVFERGWELERAKPGTRGMVNAKTRTTLPINQIEGTVERRTGERTQQQVRTL